MRARIRSVLSFRAELDSDVLFEWRLRELTFDPDYACQQVEHQLRWLGENRPDRAVRFLVVVVDLALQGVRIEDGQVCGAVDRALGYWEAHPNESQTKDEYSHDLAKNEPDLAWAQIVPRLPALAARARSLRDQSDHFDLWRSVGSLTKRLCGIASAAGRVLVKREGLAFAKRLGRLNASRAKADWLKRLIAESLLDGDAQLADWAMNWLVGDSPRFRIVTFDWSESSCDLACKLLSQYSDSCSGEVFKAAEDRVLNYRDPSEMEAIANAVATLRDGKEATSSEVFMDASGRWGRFTSNRIGFASYRLLNAMSRARLTTEGARALRCWRNKFGPILSSSNRLKGVEVRSSLDGKCDEVSDKAWRRVALGPRRRWCRNEEVFGHPAPDGSGGLVRNTRSMLASAFGTCARSEPERFARLAAEFGDEVPDAYFSRVLWALGETSGPKGIEGWAPATLETMERLIGKLAARLADDGVARSLCWVFEKHPGLNWTTESLAILSDLAINHPDPADQENNLDGLNCVRGAAASAISRLLWGNPERVGILSPALEHLFQEEQHEGVVRRALEALAAIVQVDRDRAIGTFLDVCGRMPERILYSNGSVEMINRCLLDEPKVLRRLVERMVDSTFDEVATLGAEVIVYLAFREGALRDLEAPTRGPREAHTLGRARALISLLDNRVEVVENPSHALIQLFDSESQPAQAQAATIFSREGIFDHPDAVLLLNGFVHSASIHRFAGDVLFRLKHAGCSVMPFRHAIVEMIAASGEASSDGFWYGSEYAELLLRLYDESDGDSKARDTCLNAWDALLASGVHGVEAQLGRFD